MSEKTKEQLSEENSKLRKALAETTERLKVSEATRGKTAKPVVKIDNEHYEVVGGLANSQGSISREELAKDEAKCRQLIANGSELLRKVKTK